MRHAEGMPLIDPTIGNLLEHPMAVAFVNINTGEITRDEQIKFPIFVKVYKGSPVGTTKPFLTQSSRLSNVSEYSIPIVLK